MGKAHLEHPTQATACGTIATQHGLARELFEIVSIEERCRSCQRTLDASRAGRPAYSGEVVGIEVRPFRKRLGITQEELARLLDVRVLTVSRWETGSHAPRGGGPPVVMAAIGRVLARYPGNERLVYDFLRQSARRGGLSSLLEDLLEQLIVWKGRTGS